MKYRTFIRSAKSFEELGRARKIIKESDLTAEEARERCYQYNTDRSYAQIKAGTKMEFEKDD